MPRLPVPAHGPLTRALDEPDAPHHQAGRPPRPASIGGRTEVSESENPALADPKPREESASPQGTDSTADTSESENPALKGPSFDGDARPRSNRDWWPNQVDVQRAAPGPRAESDLLGAAFDYSGPSPSGFDAAVKADLVAVMRTSQDWWPADYGHYGPFFIRMSGTPPARIASSTAAAAAVTCASSASRRSTRGRTTATSTRPAVSVAGQAEVRRATFRGLTCWFSPATSPRGHGLRPIFGFAFGREDIWEPEEVFWGPEDSVAC